MTQPILPKLKKNHNIKNFKEFGKWDLRERDSLDQLASGLKVDQVETEISSIPDMWARPMLFEMALLNREHVLHSRILGEWRGLLAMLALKEVVKLNRLTATQVTLPQARRIRNDADDSDETTQRDFLRTLAKLLPKATLANDTSWQSLYLFLFNGRPIGMTSPTTLVATAADYLDRISSQDVRWYDGTHLHDPALILPPRQKQILAGWLVNIIARMDGHRGIDNDRWNLLSGLLRSFSQELGPGIFTASKSGFGIQGSEAGIFKYLDKPADGNITDASHVRLIPSEGRTPAKPLLVLERSIAEQWDMSPQNVTVDGAQTLASPNVQVANADVWKGDDFFTKKLFVIFQENAFPGTLGMGNKSLTLPGGTTNVTPILPLNAELMQHLTADDLARCVRWDQTSEGLKIRLFLQVSGPDLNSPGRGIELTKLYRREIIQTLDNVPILEIWPNFKAIGWKAYYTCYSTDDVNTTFEAKPHSLTETVDSEVKLAGRRQRLYWRSTAYPEAMICRATVPNPQTNQLDMHDAGLLLLTPPQIVARQGHTYKVGIDFGASSTTICARTGQDSFPVMFANRKTSVTASGDRAQAQLFDFFMPRRETEMPVLSFFHDFNNNLGGQELRPFLDGHAYLLETPELFDPDTKGLAFDLKWSRDGNDRRRVRAFLTQLCLQTAAELVVRGASGARWAFSYPTAFSDEQMEGFPAIWTQVTADCTEQSGLKQIEANSRRTESEAAALYFVTHRNAATAVGAIFIDIGGSTSDVSIWQDDRPVWQTSVLLAGRSIFSNYLWHNPEFLGSFGVDVSVLTARKKKSGTDKRPYHAVTDTLLRYNSEYIFQHLPLHAATPQVTALRQHLALGISGLFYYVGSLLRYLVVNRLYRQATPNVYVAGNGSRILRWLDIDGEGHINALYKALFSRGANWDEEKAFAVYRSEEPKTEAAYGLVSDMNLEGNNASHKVLAGETFIAEETLTTEPSAGSRGDTHSNKPCKMPWDTILTPEIFTKRLASPEKLERFSEFLDTFNQFAKNQGLVSATTATNEHLEEVRRRLGQSLNRYRSTSETAKIVVEPVFIMALRHWLEIRLGG